MTGSGDPAFRIYLLAGQSNMAGRGVVGEEDRGVHPRVWALDRMARWVPAREPLHFDKPTIVGVGPGFAFGKAVAERYPDDQVGLVPCAVGGSLIRSWVPGGYWEQTKSHPYDDAIARTRKALERGVLSGILWHQGESDSNEQEAGLYHDRLVDLIRRLRTDLDAPEAPFIVATLGDFVVARNPWAERVNHVLRGLLDVVPWTACVEVEGLGHGGDDLHFDAASARTLGHRYAEAIICLQEGADG